jgi:hypothetical protein
MVESVLLIDGSNLDDGKLRGVSLANAKQLVWGRLGGTGVVLHVAATTTADLEKAIVKFSGVTGVTSVMTLAIRTA